MIPVGRERNDKINRWLGWRWGVDERGWTWMQTPDGLTRHSVSDLRGHHWSVYLPRHSRPGEWSTDDAAALELAKQVAGKDDWLLMISLYPPNSSPKLFRVIAKNIVTDVYIDADADTLADAITQAVCRVIDASGE